MSISQALVAKVKAMPQFLTFQTHFDQLSGREDMILEDREYKGLEQMVAMFLTARTPDKGAQLAHATQCFHKWMTERRGKTTREVEREQKREDGGRWRPEAVRERNPIGEQLEATWNRMERLAKRREAKDEKLVRALRPDGKLERAAYCVKNGLHDRLYAKALYNIALLGMTEQCLVNKALRQYGLEPYDALKEAEHAYWEQEMIKEQAQVAEAEAWAMAEADETAQRLIEEGMMTVEQYEEWKESM